MIIYQAHSHGVVLALAIPVSWLRYSACVYGCWESSTFGIAKESHRKHSHGEQLVIGFAILAISQSTHIVDPQRNPSPIENQYRYLDIFSCCCCCCCCCCWYHTVYQPMCFMCFCYVTFITVFCALRRGRKAYRNAFRKAYPQASLKAYRKASRIAFATETKQCPWLWRIGVAKPWDCCIIASVFIVFFGFR